MTLKTTLEIPLQSPSNNEIRGLHFFEYKQLRQKWKRLLWAAVNGRVPATVKKAWVVVERHCSGSLDWDNVCGGLKPILDCLVVPTKRNPDGLGFIENDNLKSMPLCPLVIQKPAPQGKGKTIIYIYEIENEQTPKPQHLYAACPDFEGYVTV